MNWSCRFPKSLTCLVSLYAIIQAPSIALADDWPQYRGPNRDDVSKETGLLDSWPASGPRLVWIYEEAGRGYSGPAIVGKRLYTLGDRDEDCFLIALDLPVGAVGLPKQAWAVKLGAKFDFKGNSWSAGSSATPTVDGDRIYALAGNGDLVCVSAAGNEQWRSYLPDTLNAEVNPIGGGPKKLGWGFTWAPLIDDEKLIGIPGGPKGTVAAFDKSNGKVLWRSKELTDQAAYTSPMVATIGGVRQYVVLTNQHIAGVAADTGKLLWKHPQRWGTEVVNSPMIRDNRVFVSVGAGGGGCQMIEVHKKESDFEAKAIYDNKHMANHHGNLAIIGDHLFGNSQGTGWTKLSWETGEIISSTRNIGPGALTYADGRFYYMMEQDGSILLLDHSGAEVKIVSRFKLPKSSELRKPNGRFWTPPVICNGHLYLRDQNLLFSYDVRK